LAVAIGDDSSGAVRHEGIEAVLRERLEVARAVYETDRKNPVHVDHYIQALRQFTEFASLAKIPEDLQERKSAGV
jgi:hypothetical protein